MGIHGQGVHHCFVHFRAWRRPEKTSLRHPQETSAIGADPQSIFLSEPQGSDVIVRHFRNIPAVEYRKLRAVESDQAFLGSQPEVAPADSSDRSDQILRQSVYRTPLPDIIMGSFGIQQTC